MPSVQEPQVTVRNIPASNYQGQLPNSAGGGGVPTGDQGGIMGNIKKHWPVYTVIIGVLTLVAIVYFSNSSNQNLASSSQGSASGVGTGNSSSDQLYGSQLDSDYQQMMQLQNQQISFLQQIANGIGGTSTTASSTPASSVNYQLQVPGVNPKGTVGESNNFIIYTTKATDTLASLTQKAGWTAAKQKGGGVSFTYNYRNNADIFHALGIDVSHPNQKLPAGIKIAL